MIYKIYTFFNENFADIAIKRGPSLRCLDQDYEVALAVSVHE